MRTTWESERERQPLSLDGQVWMTGDIRLDRRHELLDRLRAAGCHPEREAADVDLVLHAYRVWGEACLERLSGDFAFAIWDGPEQRLFCARDQFGVVPFYYAETTHGLVVSNHLNCLRLHPHVSDALNEQVIGDFLLFNMNQDLDTTTFADIRKLPPAHILVWSHGGVRVRRYWQLPQDVAYVRYKRPEMYIEQFRELFQRAVADRLRTDRAGTHLSGGMDSTSISATAYQVMTAMNAPAELRAYTIVYNRLLADEEGDYAAQVAETIGLPLEYLVAEDYIEQAPLEPPAHVYPEPLAIPNQVAEVEITRRIAQHSRVLLAGFGGDPAFYPSRSYWSQLWQRGELLHVMQDTLSYMRAFHRLPRLGLRSLFRRQRSSEPPKIEMPDWLNPDFIERLQLKARLQERLTASPQTDRYGMASAPLWSNIFAWSDPGFSGFPVKVRFPFFDVHLVQYLLSVPPAPWFERKFLLRQAMQGVLPDAVRLRAKTPLQGFAHYNLMQQQGLQPWMVKLVTTPALSPYVNDCCLLQRLQNLAELTPVIYNQSIPVLQLGYWLNHQYHQKINF
ncbi:MAG: hypothetical protein ETSY1_02480 [Candidatus Entotheonella factor]|uniref:asparagine synthase (glutamine-hydrolyzing) n=1 Tax=Entotheonella factor TaxID=1429438 RepID=W4LXU2_ENTF1|nr:MAG: hypothetical protein ETSY1_02480 [Candidatus Entotheonella factor]